MEHVEHVPVPIQVLLGCVWMLLRKPIVILTWILILLVLQDVGELRA
jgi:hypothetical protein